MRTITMTILLGGVLACSNGLFGPSRGPTEIEFFVTGMIFGDGETIVAVLANRSDDPLGYNLCLATLERRMGESWLKVQRHEPGSVCTLPLYTMQPGGSASLLQAVRPTMPSGVYRFRDEVEWPLEDGRITIVTNEFRIES
jgi:hypothetical protein